MDEKKRASQASIKEHVEKSYTLTQSLLDWKEVGADMFSGSHIPYLQCVLRHTYDDGYTSVRQYFIVKQWKLDENGCDTDEVELYLLFSLHRESVGEIGDFRTASLTEEGVKRFALREYKFVFGYALSHLLEE